MYYSFLPVGFNISCPPGRCTINFHVSAMSRVDTCAQSLRSYAGTGPHEENPSGGSQCGITRSIAEFSTIVITAFIFTELRRVPGEAGQRAGIHVIITFN
jgi:hypothetical protein